MVPAIIIARGGSKRLPRKNVLPFCGLPLVEWSIIQTCCSHHIGPENIYLSTDDDEIASIGERHHINIIRRPDYPNPDELGGYYIYNEAIKEILKTRDFDAFMTVMPTCPMRFPDGMDRAIAKYKKVAGPGFRALMWAVPQHETYFLKRINKQQIMPWMLDKTGAFWKEAVHNPIVCKDFYAKQVETAGSTDKAIEDRVREVGYGKLARPTYFLEAKWFQEFDIDNQDDFELCEILMERYILKGRGEKIYYDYRETK